MAKKIDRRVRYTKMVLKDSLSELLEEKPIEKITVKEVCDKADINRGTFYSHYSDQYDLYDSVVNEIVDGVFEHMGDFMAKDTDDIIKAITNVFLFLKENNTLVKTLINRGVRYSVEKRIYTIFENIYNNNPNKRLDSDLVSCGYQYMSAGAIALIRNWLNSDMQRTPEEMALFSIKLVSGGFNAFD